MKNFLILITYKVPMEIVEQHTPAHREYLRSQYAAGRLLLSGPLVPRTGGVLWAQAEGCSDIESMISNDPFELNGVAAWDIREFNPVMSADLLKPVLDSQK